MMPKQGTLPHTRNSKHGRGGGDTAWAPLRGAAAATRTRPRGDGGGAAQYSLNRRCRRRRRLREYFKVVMLPEVNSCTMRPQLSPLVRRMRATTTYLYVLHSVWLTPKASFLLLSFFLTTPRDIHIECSKQLK